MSELISIYISIFSKKFAENLFPFFVDKMNNRLKYRADSEILPHSQLVAKKLLFFIIIFFSKVFFLSRVNVLQERQNKTWDNFLCIKLRNKIIFLMIEVSPFMSFITRLLKYNFKSKWNSKHFSKIQPQFDGNFIFWLCCKHWFLICCWPHIRAFERCKRYTDNQLELP